VEYRSIPWESTGKQHLTVHLGLFYLAWLAAAGDNALQFKYPSFDSCWPRLDGTLIHNTTGLAVKKLVSVEHPEPEREKGAVWIDIEAESGQHTVMTLESARTLDITKANGRFYYCYAVTSDVGETQMALVTEDIPVFDEDSQQLGYFDAVTWKIGTPSRPSSSKRPRRK
jgi:hypothetical protein